MVIHKKRTVFFFRFMKNEYISSVIKMLTTRDAHINMCNVCEHGLEKYAGTMKYSFSCGSHFVICKRNRNSVREKETVLFS